MKEITLPSGKYLMVELLDDACDFEIKERVSMPHLFYHYSRPHRVIPQPWYELLPFGNWQIIGKADEIDWSGIAEKDTDGNGEQGFINYTGDYGKKDSVWYGCFQFYTATESGHSLLSSHGMKPETTLLLRLIPSGLAIDSTKVK